MEDVKKQSVKRLTTHIIDFIWVAAGAVVLKVWHDIVEIFTEREWTWTFVRFVLATVAFGLIVLLLLFLVAQFVIVVAERAMSDSPENHQASQEQSEDARETNDAIRDILILHTEGGRKEAYRLKSNLQSEPSLSDIKVDVIDEIGAGVGKLSIMDQILKTYRYIFLYLSADFTVDGVAKFNSESSILEGLARKTGRVIPIWPSQDIKKNGNFPQYIRTITGIQYYDYFDEPHRNSFREKINRLVSEGREKYLKD